MMARNFWTKNERKTNKRKEKNTVARWFGRWEGLCFSEEGRWEQINVENKTVEMVVKDLLLADNQKKKKMMASSLKLGLMLCYQMMHRCYHMQWLPVYVCETSDLIGPNLYATYQDGISNICYNRVVILFHLPAFILKLGFLHLPCINAAVNMTKTVIKILQSNAATKIEKGGSIIHPLDENFLHYVSQKLWKSVDICQSYKGIQSRRFRDSVKCLVEQLVSK